MFELYTEQAIMSLALAGDEARARRYNFLGTEMLLMGLLLLGKGVAWQVLDEAGVTSESVGGAIADLVGERNDEVEPEIPFTAAATGAIELAWYEAYFQAELAYIGTEHLLLGLDRDHYLARRILADLAPDLQIRESVYRLLKQPVIPHSLDIDESPHTIKCRYCNANIRNGAQFCLPCGADL
ncbi:MAG: hypothetical protein KC652_01010 [Cyanobacteria bacterium HKST-UBA01]|nr:hypothetical protein [Cyanobacteria bacterium HKST-UBA01]